jgi:hypothetical protein
MKKYGIRILSSADGERVPIAEALWLKAYDADANAGRGGFEVTDDPLEALAFLTTAEAVVEVNRVSTERPCDNEGNLNRPLRVAFDVAIEALPEAA